MRNLTGEPTPTRRYRVRVTTEERFEFVVEAEDSDRAEDIARDRAQPGCGERYSIHAVAHLEERHDD